MPQGTLIEVTREGGDPLALALVEAVAPFAPELREIPGETQAGTVLQYPVRLKDPEGDFRRLNEGVEMTPEQVIQRIASMAIFDATIKIDKRALEANPRGADAERTSRSLSVLRGSSKRIGRQIWEGADDENDLGFPGAKAIVKNWKDQGFDVEVDAGGTTANGCSSVYLVYVGEFGAQLRFGMDKALTISDFQDTLLPDGKGGTFPGEYADGGCWIGFVAQHPLAIVRIKNLTNEPGHMLTDKLLTAAHSKLAPEMRLDKANTIIFSPNRDLVNLQGNRTFIANSKEQIRAGSTADFPTEYAGIRIVETTNISITDDVDAD